MTEDIRGIKLWTMGLTATSTVLGPTDFGGVGKQILRISIRNILGGHAGKPYLV